MYVGVCVCVIPLTDSITDLSSIEINKLLKLALNVMHIQVFGHTYRILILYQQANYTNV